MFSFNSDAYSSFQAATVKRNYSGNHRWYFIQSLFFGSIKNGTYKQCSLDFKSYCRDYLKVSNCSALIKRWLNCVIKILARSGDLARSLGSHHLTLATGRFIPDFSPAPGWILKTYTWKKQKPSSSWQAATSRNAAGLTWWGRTVSYYPPLSVHWLRLSTPYSVISSNLKRKEREKFLARVCPDSLLVWLFWVGVELD